MTMAGRAEWNGAAKLRMRVILADDHVVVRQGLRTLLEAEPDIHIIGEADNGQEAVRLTKKLLPDLVLMDIAMPVLNGLEATRQIRAQVPTAKVVVLSSYGDEAFVRDFLELGVHGYLLKQAAARDLIAALRAVYEGRTWFSAEIARTVRLSAAGRAGTATRPGRDPLTARERQVLQLIAEGKCNKEIGALLGISVKTVEKHRQQVMNKLNIHDVAGLTRHAIAIGLIEDGRWQEHIPH